MERRSAGEPQAPPKEQEVKLQQGPVDIWLIAIVALLIIFGMLMLFSASYPKALNETGDSYYYIKEQAKFLLLGIGASIVAVMLPWKAWQMLAWPSMVFAFFFLIVVLFMDPINDANRWFVWELPFMTIRFQPSEIAKLSIILVFAFMLKGHQKRLNKIRYGMWPFAIVLGLIAVLLLAEPHVSATILIIGIGLGMMYCGGVPLKWILLIVGVGLGLALLVWVIRPPFLEHAFIRIETFRDFEMADADSKRQTMQSLMAIGSGGLTGRGLGKSRQKYLFLPEMHNDYIFAILCEELGLIGAMGVLALFFALLVRCLVLSRRVENRFCSMMMVGISLQITLQALLHMAVNLNAIPATGISLPFFSYGGTALIMQIVEMALVLSISRQAVIKRPAQPERQPEEKNEQKPGKKPPKQQQNRRRVPAQSTLSQR